MELTLDLIYLIGDIMDKFGFGMMRLPQLDENDPTKVDIEQVSDLYNYKERILNVIREYV